MLRQVFITKDGVIIFKRDFGKGLDKEGFNQAYKQISSEAFKIAVENTKYHDFFKYRIGYLSIPNHKVIIFFISDLSDKFANVKKELERCRKEFIDLFGAILDEKLDEDTFEIFDPTIELIHKNLRPKISLVGFSGVGKTTITRLITAEDIPMEHVPTITGDIGTIKIGKLHFHLWDFAGQEQFSFLWNNFIKGSDAVLLITDSSLENCEKSKYFIELIKKEAPYAHTAAIGNKQDLPDAMSIADIERHLGIKAYSMIATDPDNRNKMITIIADILEMSGEVSPLLKPLLERDNVLKEAETALESGQFYQAVGYFERLADLSLELGDDRVSQDFLEKAQKIKSILGSNAPPIQPQDKIEEDISIPSKSEINNQESNQKILKIEEDIPLGMDNEEDLEEIIQSPENAPLPVIKPLPKIQNIPNSTVERKSMNSIPPPPPVSLPIPNIPKPPENVSSPSLSKITPPPPPIVPPNGDGSMLHKPTIGIPPSPPIPPKTYVDQSIPQELGELNLDNSKPSQMDQLGLMLNKLQPKTNTPSPSADIKHTSSLGAPPTILNSQTNIAQKMEAIPSQGEKIPIQKPSTPTAVPIKPPEINTNLPPPYQINSAASKNQTQSMITDLKIKIANVNKTLLDLEMDNITGDLSDADFENKSGRLNAVKVKLEQQIKELEQI